jgi:hypothetical protein
MESHAVAYLSQAPMRSEGLRTTKAFLACEGQALLEESLAGLIKLFCLFVKFLGPKEMFVHLSETHIIVQKNPEELKPLSSFFPLKVGDFGVYSPCICM